MIVIISGQSGSGKSVLAQKIAKRYKLKCIHASDLLKQLREKEFSKISVSKTHMNKGWWESKEGQKYLSERMKNAKFDKLLDRELLKIIKKGNIVMDSRTMPYLSKKGFKILLTASVEERAKRISKRDKRKIPEIMRAIRKKSLVERKLYKKLYGFDQEKDTDVYNLVINTDGFNESQVWGIASSVLDSTFCKK